MQDFTTPCRRYAYLKMRSIALRACAGSRRNRSISEGVFTKLIAVFAAVGVCAVSTSFAAVTFIGPTGSLIVNSGTDMRETSANLLGTFNANANSALGSAVADLTVAVPASTQFAFDGSATSTSEAGSSTVRSSLTFVELFNFDEPMRVILSGAVTNSGDQPGAIAQIVVNDGNQDLSIALLEDTGGATESRSLVFQPVANPQETGLHSLGGTIFTNAAGAGSHTGAISGSLVITLPADVNADLAVTGADLSIWRGGFGSTNATYKSGDMDNDRKVTGSDFFQWQRDFGRSIATSGISGFQSVPEPASLYLLVTAALGFGMRRFRRSVVDC